MLLSSFRSLPLYTYYNNKFLLCQEFKLWNDSLTEKEQNDAMGFFTVVKRHSEFSLDSSSPNHAVHGTNHLMTAHDLYSVPYSKEYNSFLRKAAELLHEAGDLAGSPRYIELY
jgi:hypothetical protein